MQVAPLRARVAHLTQLTPTHQFSQMDSAGPAGLRRASAARILGRTQWIAQLGPDVVFGWDWVYERRMGWLQGRWTTLRTNLVVVDENDVDLGVDCLRLCVARLMTHVEWERAVVAALRLDEAA